MDQIHGVGKGQSDLLTGRTREMGNGMVEVVAREKANAWVGVFLSGAIITIFMARLQVDKIISNEHNILEHKRNR